MNITQRLMLTFFLMSTALLAVAITAIILLSGFQGRFEAVQSNAIPSIKDLSQLVEKSHRLMLTLYQHQSQTDNSKMPPIETNLQNRYSELKSLTDHYLENDISSDEDRRMTNIAYGYIEAIGKKLPEFLSASREHHDDVTLSLIEGNSGVGQSIRALTETYKKQFALNVAIGDGLREVNHKTYERTLWGLSLGVLAVILILGTFAIKVIVGIRRSLQGIRETMTEVSESLDLTIVADVRRHDEIGTTGSAFNALMKRVSEALTSVSSASHSVSSASAQIAAGNEDLSARTEEQAASLEQTASSMAELSETVRQTADNTRQASLLADSVNELSEKNADSLHTMMGTMEGIRNSSRKITDIITLIEGVAFQTNILALNAAVEAARAGEHGKGFAVVAGEVRNLSQRSTTAAREIKELIDNSSLLIETGADQAEDVSKNMMVMKGAIRQVTDLVNEIAAAASEQSQGITQVHQAVNQMDDVTQQNAALVEEASAASQSLGEQASMLSQLVGEFRLNKAPERYESSVNRNLPYIPPSSNLSARIKPSSVTTEEDNWQSF
ncbi:HAMP domain-containing protein (plasmid) [Erwinia rhapontici]|uniref:methyl-accepting chemotaxis protein n=1 Tax=Erwinia rhapontici TaxID=55212 RepID=UPI0014386734|nr:methyl-accepting chemotaxis protein [Erwinia rhapontici]NKG29404.1 HAMP domain-containing protein [Erwinia rhapontici]